LRLTYADGGIVTVDFKPLLERGGVFSVLGESDFFSQVSLDEGGRYIEWPGEVDFCADAFWLQAHGWIAVLLN
jgi:hypothetical protein